MDWSNLGEVTDWSDLSKMMEGGEDSSKSKAGADKGKAIDKKQDKKGSDQWNEVGGKEQQDQFSKPASGIPSEQANHLDNIAVEGWTDMKQFDDDHDPDWFEEEEKRLAEIYGGHFIKVKYTEQGKPGYFCELCLSEMNAKKSLEAHCEGMKHLKKKALWEKNNAEQDAPRNDGRKGGWSDNIPPRDRERSPLWSGRGKSSPPPWARPGSRRDDFEESRRGRRDKRNDGFDRRGPPKERFRSPPRDGFRSPPRDSFRGSPEIRLRGPPKNRHSGPPEDPFESPSNGRFGSPPTDRFGGPPVGRFGGPPVHRFRGPPADRFGGPPIDRFEGPPVDRFGGPHADRFGGPPVDRFGGPPVDRFGGPPADRFGGPPADRFGGPPADRFGGPPADRFGGPPGDRFGGPPGNRFGGPPADKFGGPPAERFGGPPAERFSGTPSSFARDDASWRDPYPTAPAPVAAAVAAPPPKEKLNGGTTGLLLTKLASCYIKDEEDADLALNVISSLSSSLREYNTRKGEKKIAELLMEAELKLNTLKALKVGLKLLNSKQTLAATSGTRAAATPIAPSFGPGALPKPGPSGPSFGGRPGGALPRGYGHPGTPPASSYAEHPQLFPR